MQSPRNGDWVRVMKGTRLLVAGLALTNALAMAKVDLGGPRVLPQLVYSLLA